jgi:hypothetical protein
MKRLRSSSIDVRVGISWQQVEERRPTGLFHPSIFIAAKDEAEALCEDFRLRVERFAPLAHHSHSIAPILGEHGRGSTPLVHAHKSAEQQVVVQLFHEQSLAPH